MGLEPGGLSCPSLPQPLPGLLQGQPTEPHSWRACLSVGLLGAVSGSPATGWRRLCLETIGEAGKKELHYLADPSLPRPASAQ